MRTPNSIHKVDSKRTMPGSFDKKEETEHTPYMVKSVQANTALACDNFLARFFSWLILAGYVIFPGAFTSLKTSKTLASCNAGRGAQDTAKYVLLLILVIVYCRVRTCQVVDWGHRWDAAVCYVARIRAKYSVYKWGRLPSLRSQRSVFLWFWRIYLWYCESLVPP